MVKYSNVPEISTAAKFRGKKNRFERYSQILDTFTRVNDKYSNCKSRSEQNLQKDIYSHTAFEC